MPLGDRFPAVLEAARAGSDPAWAELYEDLAPVMLRFLTRLGANEPEDALGEAFVQLVRHLPRFTGDEVAFRAWAFQVARHRAIDSWRAAARRPWAATGSLETVHERLFQHEPADTQAIQSAAVERILSTLTTDQRAVLTLRILDRFSVDETAQILGRTPGSIRVLQHRAVQALRTVLDAERVETLPPVGMQLVGGRAEWSSQR